MNPSKQAEGERMIDPEVVLPRLRTHGVIVREVQDELLIYDLETNNALCLSPAARLIADHCDGTTTVREVVEKLATGRSAEAAEVLVLTVLRRLENEGLLEGLLEFHGEADQPTRRQVLTAAAALGIAVPLVSFLAVPTAMAQQSGCSGILQPCSVQASTCCAGLTCESTGPSTAQCCVPLLGTCFTVEDCCSGLACNDGTCGPPVG
jgi:hypothetical protein